MTVPSGPQQQLSAGIQGIDSGTKTQSAHGLISENHSLVIQLQPQIDVSTWAALSADGARINGYLAEAQRYAGKYLSRIQPSILCCLDDTTNYYALHGSVPLGKVTKQDWLNVLAVLQDQAKTCRDNARSVASSLEPLSQNLTTGASQLSQAVSALNSATNGPQGTLASIDSQLKEVNASITGEIVGIVVSGIVLVGGVVVSAVGVMMNVVTPGSGSMMVLGGVALVIVGAGGVLAASLMLAHYLDQKRQLLEQKSQLAAQVTTALAMSSSYSMLLDKVQASTAAANQMQDAWKTQTDVLSGLSSDLSRGLLDPAVLQTSWTGAQGILQQATTNATTVQSNLTGMTKVRVPKNVSLSDYVKQFSAPTTPAQTVV